MTKHTIISWDSTFRNFFHLLKSLAELEWGRDRLQVIFVEQRSAATAAAYAEAEGCKTVAEVAAEVADRLDVTVVYLHEDDAAYHPGRLLNAGLSRATGDIVSTMDADILVPRQFLRVLDELHKRGPRVVTMHRPAAAFPCGTTKADWKNQIIDYELVRNLSPEAFQPLAAAVNNKAPLLSTRRENWEAIGGYDEHRLFSTAYTMFGRDVSLRFRLLLGDVELPMPMVCIHPWHPTEVNRSDKKVGVLFAAQQGLMKWAEERGLYDVRARQAVADQLYADNRQLVESAIAFAEDEQMVSTRKAARNAALEKSQP
jgi:hypothetical protein